MASVVRPVPPLGAQKTTTCPAACSGSAAGRGSVPALAEHLAQCRHQFFGLQGLGQEAARAGQHRPPRQRHVVVPHQDQHDRARQAGCQLLDQDERVGAAQRVVDQHDVGQHVLGARQGQVGLRHPIQAVVAAQPLAGQGLADRVAGSLPLADQQHAQHFTRDQTRQQCLPLVPRVILLNTR